MVPSSTEASETTARLEFARDATRRSSELILQHFDGDVAVERKSDDSPVTVADRGAEQLLREQILTQFPDDTVLGEEFGLTSGGSAYRWILDPIDGTKSFIAGVPLFGTLIGLQRDEKSVAGMIELPALDRRIWASEGQGAWWQMGHAPPRRASVSKCERLADGLLLTSEITGFAARGAPTLFARMESAAWYGRTWGDCYGYFLVATGRAVAMIDPELHLWDAAALLPIVNEAGGRFSDWSGQSTVASGDGLGTNGRVHDELLRIIQSAPAEPR